MEFKTEIITPAIAAKYLQCNTENRRLRPTSVKGLAAAMSRGEWMQTPEGISFSTDGVLLDGQHRLEAVCMSQKTVTMTVCRGASPDVFSVINRGVPRSLADSTKLPARHVEILNFFYSLKPGRTGKATSAQIAALNAVFADEIESLTAFAPSMTKGFSQVGARAAVVILAKEGARVRAFDIYRRLTLSDFSSLPPCVAALVKQIVSGRMVGGKGAGGQIESFTRVLFALDEKNANKSSLSITEGFYAQAASRARKWIL